MTSEMKWVENSNLALNLDADPMSAAYASAGAAQSSGVYGYDDTYGSGLAPMSRAGPSHMPQKINQVLFLFSKYIENNNYFNSC